MTEKIAKALELTIENAESLYEDAFLLKENSKYGRAYSLYHLCFEECGRFHLINNLFNQYITGRISAKDLNYGRLKKLGYEKHDIKITESLDGTHLMALVYNQISQDQAENEESKQEIKSFFEEINKEMEGLRAHENDFNRLKNVGLYVTFNNNDFHLPDKTITVAQFLRIEKLASLSLHMVRFVKKFADGKGGFTSLRKSFEDEINKKH